MAAAMDMIAIIMPLSAVVCGFMSPYLQVNYEVCLPNCSHSSNRPVKGIYVSLIEICIFKPTLLDPCERIVRK